MKFREYITESDMLNENKYSNIVRKVLMNIRSESIQEIKFILYNGFLDFVNYVKENGLQPRVLKLVNDYYGVKFGNLDSIARQFKITNVDTKVKGVMGEGVVGDLLSKMKENIMGAAQFMPLLQMFLELDKVIKSAGDANLQATIVYGLLWLGIVTGSFTLDKLTNKYNAVDNKGKATVE